MHSEPPRAEPKKPKRAPKILRRQLDALFADIPRERRRAFFAKAYQILEKSADEILRSETGVWGDAVPKFREDRGLTLMKMASEIAGIAERADKREEPFRKIMIGLLDERPNTLVQVGQIVTSPVFNSLLPSADSHRNDSSSNGKAPYGSAEDASELPGEGRNGTLVPPDRKRG